MDLMPKLRGALTSLSPCLEDYRQGVSMSRLDSACLATLKRNSTNDEAGANLLYIPKLRTGRYSA